MSPFRLMALAVVAGAGHVRAVPDDPRYPDYPKSPKLLPSCLLALAVKSKCVRVVGLEENPWFAPHYVVTGSAVGAVTTL